MYKHLTNEVKHSRLIALRDAVKPILANNLLPYFTAHDVEHCDRVTTVIDAFIEPFQSAANRLTDDELFVVYAAAYLHDIGMQYENVGNSRRSGQQSVLTLGKRCRCQRSVIYCVDIIPQYRPNW